MLFYLYLWGYIDRCQGTAYSPRHSQSVLYWPVSSLGTLIAIVAVTLPLVLALSSPSLDSSFLASLEGFKPTRIIVLLILSTFQGLVSPRPSLNTDLRNNQDLSTVGRWRSYLTTSCSPRVGHAISPDTRQTILCSNGEAPSSKLQRNRFIRSRHLNLAYSTRHWT